MSSTCNKPLKQLRSSMGEERSLTIDSLREVIREELANQNRAQAAVANGPMQAVNRREAVMSEIANTPVPPYYAVIFSSHRTEGDNGYAEMAERMVELASEQPGFLGIESARENVGITVSYWASLEAISNWKKNAEHREAQQLGHQQWYSTFRVRVAKVEREYGI